MARRSSQTARNPIWRFLAAGISLLVATATGAVTGAWVAVTTPEGPPPAPSDATARPRQGWPGLTAPMHILVLGIDYNGYGRHLSADGGRTRTDTLLLVRIDPRDRRVSALSIPRDTRVELPGYGIDKINAANVYGGADLVKETVTGFLGVPVDRYVKLDLKGAEKLIDLIGGVDLDVERAFHYDDWAGRLHVHLKPGYQHLGPKEAVAYARFRHDNQGDLGRVTRQQRLLQAVAAKLFQPGNLLRLPQLLGVARDHIETDLTPADLTHLVATVPDLWRQEMRWATVPGHYSLWRGVSYWEADVAGTGTLVARLFSRAPLAADDSCRVLVLDAQKRPAVVQQVAAALEAQGFAIAGIRQVSARHYPTTMLIDRRADEQPARWQQLQTLIRPEQTRLGDPIGDEAFEGDYVVILGPRFQTPTEADNP